MVAPSGMTSSATSGTSSSEECPPDTSKATAGDGSVPCSSWSTAMCAARWLTPYSGLPSAKAYALAAATPTSSAPARPGPAVTATASISAGPDARRGEGPVKGREHRLQVRPAGHLGHHPAEPRMLVHARRDGVGEQVVAADQPDPRLVAGRLDAQHQGGDHHRSPFRMTTASTPDGW